MTDAPERIWVWPDYNDHFNPVKQDWTHGFWDSTEDSLGTEYVRVDNIKAQAAEIERLNTQCEGLFQAAINNGQALIIAEAKRAKAVEALRGWIDFANEEGMPVLLSDLEAAELTGDKT